jgi:hypothetical protein
MIMGRDEQYQCLMFELIVPLLPNFMLVLSEVCKNPDAFKNFVNLVSSCLYMHSLILIPWIADEGYAQCSQQRCPHLQNCLAHIYTT